MKSYLFFKNIPIGLKRLLILVTGILVGLQFFIISKTWYKNNSCTSSDQSSCNKKILSLPNSDDVQCIRYHFKSNDANITHESLPIYDFFIFHNEFDILEIRLHELYPYVTFFLIAESRETLTGAEKPFYLKDNWARFAKYHDKIRRIEVKLVQKTTNPWSNEHRMRNDGLSLALSTIKDDKYILLASDADEIPKARFMNALRRCSLPDPFPSLTLNCEFYYYSYEFRSKHHVYYGTTVHLISSNQSNIPSGNTLRDKRFHFKFLPSTCYHCTWCFNQIKEVHLKMASYSHTEHNQVQFRTREHILDRYQNGKDLFDRHGEEYVYIHNNQDYPELVKLQPERFLYMTKRTNLTNVGFIDA